MTRFRRWRRFGVRAIAVVLLLLIASGIAARLYLGSSAGTRFLATALSDRLATPITLDAIDAGLIGDSVVRGLTVRDEQDEPFLLAERVRVNLSLLRVLRGVRQPSVVTASGATLRLRFDRAGKMLTKLPAMPEGGQLPRLSLNNVTLILEQEGREPFTLTGAALTLTPEDSENLAGELSDPVWGKFAIAGHFTDGQLRLRARSDGVALTAAMFRAVPFVPLSLTKQLEFEGERVGLALDLRFGKERPQARYHIAFAGARARLLQADRPAFVVSGAQGALEGSDEGFAFTGHLADPYWGDWAVEADLVAGKGALNLLLETREVSVDPGKLAALPFVPRGTWDNVQAAGKTSAKVTVRLLTDKPEVHYRVELSPRDTTVRIAALDLEASAASGQVVVADNVVLLRHVQGKTASGAIRTHGSLDFRSLPTRMNFDLDVRGLVLAQLPTKWDLPRQIDGKVTGQAKLDVLLHGDRTETRGSGSGRIDEATLVGFRTSEPITLELRADDKGIRFRPRSRLLQTLMSAHTPEASGGREPPVVFSLPHQPRPPGSGVPKTTGGSRPPLAFAEPTYLDGRFTLADVDLAELARRLGVPLPLSVAGRLTLQVQLSIPINNLREPRAYRGQAALSATNVLVGDLPFPQLSANLRYEAGIVSLDQGTGESPAGRFRVTSQLDLLANDRPFTARLTLDQGTLDLAGQLRPDLHGTVEASGIRVPGVPLEAVRAAWKLDRERLQLDQLRATVAGSPVSGRGSLTLADRVGQVELTAPKLVFQGVTLENLRGRIGYVKGVANYLLEGATLGGRLTVDGKYPPPPVGSVDQSHGRVRLERIDLTRLWRLLGQGERLGALTGSAALSLPFRHDGPDLTPVGEGRFEVRDVRYQDEEVTDVLRGDVRLGRDSVTVRDASGMLAGGLLRLSGGYRFHGAGRGWFDVRLAQAQWERLPLVDSAILQGPIDVSLRGNVGVECRASGTLSLSRGKVAGVEVSEWRLPVEATWVPASGQVELHVRDSSAQVGSGRAQLRADANWTGGWRVEGNLVFVEAGLRSLAGMLGDVTSYVRGRLSGRIDFSGSEVRSLSDVTANVQATLNDAQVLQLPILKHVVPYVAPGLVSAGFHGGELRGRLSGGVFRIAEFALDSNLVLLLITGTITTQGRLDLELTAQSTAGVDPLVLRLLLQRLPPIGPVPVGLIVRVTEALADRVVRLRIGGTVRTPHVQIEPVRVLSEQAVRFFLTRAVRIAR